MKNKQSKNEFLKAIKIERFKIGCPELRSLDLFFDLLYFHTLYKFFIWDRFLLTSTTLPEQWVLFLDTTIIKDNEINVPDILSVTLVEAMTLYQSYQITDEHLLNLNRLDSLQNELLLSNQKQAQLEKNNSLLREQQADIRLGYKRLRVISFFLLTILLVVVFLLG
jgi:hypothetical protein